MFERCLGFVITLKCLTRKIEGVENHWFWCVFNHVVGKGDARLLSSALRASPLPILLFKTRKITGINLCEGVE
jgi:hypothetical protein